MKKAENGRRRLVEPPWPKWTASLAGSWGRRYNTVAVEDLNVQIVLANATGVFHGTVNVQLRH